MRVGEQWIVHRVFPQEPGRRVDHLSGKAFAIQIGDALVHVLPFDAEWQLAIKIAQITTGLLLSVANHCSEQFLDVDQTNRSLIDDEPGLACRRILLQSESAVTKGRIDVTQEEIEWLKEMTIGIDRKHRDTTLFLISTECPFFELRKPRINRSRQANER